MKKEMLDQFSEKLIDLDSFVDTDKEIEAAYQDYRDFWHNHDLDSINEQFNPHF